MLWAKLKTLFTGFLDTKDEIVKDNEDEIIEHNGNQVWCVVANVINDHPVGENKEIKRGTKHFPAGAKVYCFPRTLG